MILKNTFRLHSYYLKNGFILGAVAGILYAFVEGLADEITFPEILAPIFRGFIIGAFIGVSIGLFEILFYNQQRKLPLWVVILIRGIVFMIIINVVLIFINGILLTLSGAPESFSMYLSGGYTINLIYSLIVTAIIVSIIQINKLHRRNELFHFIFGKYHSPKEENLIFLFIDLKGSTSLAESLGNLKYGNYLKDYYSDISEPIFEYGGDVYQYVGDEIIIFWKTGTKEQNLMSVNCHNMIKKKIELRADYYEKNYNHIPDFRSSLHTGKVVATWVGEVKREILFIGDVLNTGARMLEICKKVEKDFLISGQALDILPMTDEYFFPFEEKLIPRGKQKEILVFSVERREDNVSAKYETTEMRKTMI